MYISKKDSANATIACTFEQIVFGPQRQWELCPSRRSETIHRRRTDNETNVIDRACVCAHVTDFEDARVQTIRFDNVRSVARDLHKRVVSLKRFTRT